MAVVEQALLVKTPPDLPVAQVDKEYSPALPVLPYNAPEGAAVDPTHQGPIRPEPAVQAVAAMAPKTPQETLVLP